MLAEDSLAKTLGADVWVKAEHLQRTGSFKFRGIYNRVLALSEEERDAGIITVSSGNAAIAAALSARLEGISCIVIMPEWVVDAKLEAVKGLGAIVVKHGRSDPEMFAKADELIADKGYAVVHSFDQPEVIAGHATIGLELLEEAPNVDCVLVPTSGGGLISGICIGIKELRPDIRVVGVQPEGADGIRRSLDAGKIVPCTPVDTLADGLTGDAPGEGNFEIIKRYVDDVVLVSDDEMLQAMALIWKTLRTVVEPSGAAAVAAIARHGCFRGRRIVAITSGANVDLDLLRHAVNGGSASEWRNREYLPAKS